MKFLTKALIFLLVFVFLLWFQSNHFLRIGGIIPNLILIGFLVLAFCFPEKSNMKLLVFVGLGITALSFLWFSFWIWGIILAAVFGIITNLLKRNLTGGIFVDFLISMVIATFLFYIILAIVGASFLIWPMILGELIYNLILGELALFVISFQKSSRYFTEQNIEDPRFH